MDQGVSDGPLIYVDAVDGDSGESGGDPMVGDSSRAPASDPEPWRPDPARGILSFAPEDDTAAITARVKVLRVTHKQMVESGAVDIDHPSARQMEDDIAQAEQMALRRRPARHAGTGVRNAERKLFRAQRAEQLVREEFLAVERAYQIRVVELATKSEQARVRVATAREELAGWAAVIHQGRPHATSRGLAPATRQAVDGLRVQCLEALALTAAQIANAAPRVQQLLEAPNLAPEVAQALNLLAGDLAAVHGAATSAQVAVHEAAALVEHPPSDEAARVHYDIADGADELDDDGLDEVDAAGDDDAASSPEAADWAREVRYARQVLRANIREQQAEQQAIDRRAQRMQEEGDERLLPTNGPAAPLSPAPAVGTFDPAAGDAPAHDDGTAQVDDI